LGLGIFCKLVLANGNNLNDGTALVKRSVQPSLPEYLPGLWQSTGKTRAGALFFLLI
jgi:hypothetical protein